MATLSKPSPLGISLSTAKTRLGITGDGSDALLLDLIEGATGRVARVLNRAIRQGKYCARIEQDASDETLLLGGPLAAPQITANGAAVAVVEIEPKIGELTITPPGASRLVMGALEPRAANTVYEVVYRRGWLLDEGATNEDGLVETFELLADCLAGATEIVLNGTGLVTGIPAGATLSLGDEILFVASSTLADSELSVTLLAPLEAGHAAGEVVAHVDERVPAEVQDEILALVKDSFAAATSGQSAGVESVRGDGYEIKFRDPAEVDAGIRRRLSGLVVLR